MLFRARTALSAQCERKGTRGQGCPRSEPTCAMKLPPYPRYTPSGVEWLGAVPEHWEVKRLRRVLAEPLLYGCAPYRGRYRADDLPQIPHSERSQERGQPCPRNAKERERADKAVRAPNRRAP